MIDSYMDLKNGEKMTEILLVTISVITLIQQIILILTGPTTSASKSLCSVPSIRIKLSNVSKLIYKE